MPTTAFQDHDPPSGIRDRRVFQLALSMIPGVGAISGKLLAAHFQDPALIFHAKLDDFAAIDGLSRSAAEGILAFHSFDEPVRELERMERLGVSLISIWDEEYPPLLKECRDAPTNLFIRGNRNLRFDRNIAVIGTRRCTTHGREATARIVAELAPIRPLINSGLAYGIDGCAHRAALAESLPTVAVLAHGLDRVYPVSHTGLARSIVESGGSVISEYPFGTPPEPYRFPMRNRIVAGMSSAVIVVESHRKGGSLLTANTAIEYNRSVFAAPGRLNDPASAGCLKMIENLSARIYVHPEPMLIDLGWKSQTREEKLLQRIEELPIVCQALCALLRDQPMDVDELLIASGLQHGPLASAMLTMEVSGVILSLPGKVYQLA